MKLFLLYFVEFYEDDIKVLKNYLNNSTIEKLDWRLIITIT